MSNILHSYINGNTLVQLYDDGTKIRSFEGQTATVHPDHLDIKITNWCNNPICGNFCHEKSNQLGQHGDLDALHQYLEPIPAGVELAIGGGHPLSHPDLRNFLIKAKAKGWICNLTVNSFHLKESYSCLSELIEGELIYGIGVSYYAAYHNEVINFIKKYRNAVVHTIVGIVSLTQIKRIIEECEWAKILFLGYKTFGNGVDFIQKNPSLNEKIESWIWKINNLIHSLNEKHALNEDLTPTFSFDNLAIKQLKMKRFFTEYNWNKFYCGDDGQFSMYYDAVTQAAKVSSCHKDGIKTKNVLLAFDFLRKET